MIFNPISKLKLGAAIGIGLAFLALLAWGLRLDALRGDWKAKYEAGARQANAVLVEIRAVAGRPGLTWENAGAQVRYIGQHIGNLKATIGIQQADMNDLAAERDRLMRLSAELRQKAQAAIAKREQAIAKLETGARAPLTAEEKQDSARNIREAREALDLVYQAGL